MATLTRRQAKLRKQKPNPLLRLPPEIRSMIFDELVPEKIQLRKRYMGVGGNSAIAPIFKLLCLNRQLRDEVLDYIHRTKRIFSVSLHDAHSFPWSPAIRRLDLRAVEFDQSTVFRLGNPEKDCLPTWKTKEAIEELSKCWTGHFIEELALQFSMAAHTEYKGVAFSTNCTVVSAFAPLGRFNKVRARYTLKHVSWRNKDQCVRAFVTVSKTLRKSLI
jgi:hypothetical protein